MLKNQLLWLAAFAFFGVLPVQAQDRIHNVRIVQESPEVFISEFAFVGTDSRVKMVGPFLTSALELRLVQSMAVHRSAPLTPCQAASPNARPGTQTASFFEINGSVTQSESNVTLVTILRKCDGGKLMNVVQQTSSIDMARVVDELAAVTNLLALEISKDLPRIAIAVNSCTASGLTSLPETALAQWTDDIRQRTSALLTTSGEFAPSGQADYTLFCRLRFAKGKRILIRQGAEQFDIQIGVVAHGREHLGKIMKGVKLNPSDLGTLAQTVASETLAVVRGVFLAERLGDVRIDQMQADALLARARDLLCLDSPCTLTKQSQEDALQLLLVASTKPGVKNHQVFRYLGDLQLKSGLVAEAFVSLQRAQELLLLEGSPDSQPYIQLRSELAALLGDAFLKRSQSKEAVEQFQLALKLNASQTNYSTLANALLLAGQPLQASETLLRAVQKYPDSGRLRSDTQSSIRKLPEESVQQLYSTYSPRCSAMKNECAAMLAQLANFVNEKGPDSSSTAKVAEYVDKGLRLEPSDPRTRLELLALKAISLLPVDLARADGFLAQAEAGLDHSTIPTQLREWTTGIRIMWWRLKQDERAAYETAKRAMSTYPGSQGVMLALAESALAYGVTLPNAGETKSQRESLLTEARNTARQLVATRYSAAAVIYIDASRELGTMLEAKDVFNDLVTKNPDDHGSGHSLLWICNELNDIKCIGNAARQLATGGFASKPLDLQLDMLEAAVLAEDHDNSSSWIKLLRDRNDLPASLAAVRDLYTTWVAFQSQDDAMQAKNFANWQKSVAKLREQRLDVEWSFTGAKFVLSHDGVRRRDLLSAMISATENPSAPFPVIDQ